MVVGLEHLVGHYRASKITDTTNITPSNEMQSELTTVPRISLNDANFTNAQRAVLTFSMLVPPSVKSIIMISCRGCNILCGRKHSGDRGTGSLDLLMPRPSAFVKAAQLHQ